MVPVASVSRPHARPVYNDGSSTECHREKLRATTRAVQDRRGLISRGMSVVPPCVFERALNPPARVLSIMAYCCSSSLGRRAWISWKWVMRSHSHTRALAFGEYTVLFQHLQDVSAVHAEQTRHRMAVAILATKCFGSLGRAERRVVMRSARSFGDREAGDVAQSGQDPSRSDQHAALDLRLVARPPGLAGNIVLA
jgi:hypothetical protein